MKKAVKSKKSKPAVKAKLEKTSAIKKKEETKKVTVKAPEKEVVARKTAPKVIVKKIVKPVEKVAAAKSTSKEKKETDMVKESLDKKVVVAAPATKPRKRPKGGRKPKNHDEDEPTAEQDILVNQLIKNTKEKRKKGKKKPKFPKQIRTFTNPMASLAVSPDTTKSTKKTPRKEPKGKFEIEYVVRTSPGILYEFITTPSGLSEWFADDVNIHEGVFTFFWDGSEQKAKLLGFKDEKFIRLRWLDKPEGSYFEFRIEKDELTGDISLMVVDFVDEDTDMKTSKLLWDSQINDLLSVIGSY